MASKPYQELTDAEKLQKHWHKLAGFHSREVPEAVNPLMEVFTPFQEEASFRALDLRDWPVHGGT